MRDRDSRCWFGIYDLIRSHLYKSKLIISFVVSWNQKYHQVMSVHCVESDQMDTDVHRDLKRAPNKVTSKLVFAAAVSPPSIPTWKACKIKCTLGTSLRTVPPSILFHSASCSSITVSPSLLRFHCQSLHSPWCIKDLITSLSDR